ncbi:MAG: ABC transporter permease [Anaerolineales bacterium]|nr:ABC transporter permease [Anaerolineales bacterium]
MLKLWLVAKQEYLKRVAKKSFIIGTLLIPILLGVIVGVTIFIIERDKNIQPFGIVDHSGLFEPTSGPVQFKNDEDIELIAFQAEESARSALEAGEIQAYHVIPENYLESQKVDLYYWDEYPDTSVLSTFDDYVRATLLPEGPDEIQNRIIEGTNLTLRSADGKRNFNQEIGFVAIIFPMAVAMFFFFAVMGASGYFLQAITDEKENRTMEIAITSLSPWQLISGKSLGLIAVALTQIIIWLVSIALAWIVALRVFPEIQGVKLPWDILLVFLFFFLPSFVLVSSIMAAIGGMVTELQEGQQISGILNLLFTFPLFLIALVFADPNSPLLVFLSFWPTTSLLTITLRWGLTIIPFWQIVISWLILVGSGLISIWVASRIFRIGMLRYGQRLSLKAVIAAVQSSTDTK